MIGSKNLGLSARKVHAMKKFLWTMSLFVLGIWIYVWTIKASEPPILKIFCAEAGSLALFSGIMAVLYDMKETRR